MEGQTGLLPEIVGGNHKDGPRDHRWTNGCEGQSELLPEVKGEIFGGKHKEGPRDHWID